MIKIGRENEKFEVINFSSKPNKITLRGLVNQEQDWTEKIMVAEEKYNDI